MAVGLAIRANNAVGIFSGGASNPGTAYARDNFAGYSITRGESASSKLAKLQSAGLFDYYKDRMFNADAGGDIFTNTQAQALSEFNYSGYWPPGLERALAFELMPNLGTYVEGTGRQTDTHASLNNDRIRPKTVVEFGLALPPRCSANAPGGIKDATYSMGNKFLYFAHHGVDHGFDMFINGCRANEHCNGAQSPAARTTFLNEAMPTNRMYFMYQSKGIPEGVNNVLVNTNIVNGGNTFDTAQRLSIDSMGHNDFRWVRMIREVQNGQAHIAHKFKRPGDPGWTSIEDYTGGQTSGFSHPIQASDRVTNTGLKLITVCNQFPFSSGQGSAGDHPMLFFDFGLYEDESLCPDRA